jgi:hypothetical protein
MKHLRFWFLLMFVACTAPTIVTAQNTNRNDPLAKVQKLAGPATAKMRDVADVLLR